MKELNPSPTRGFVARLPGAGRSWRSRDLATFAINKRPSPRQSEWHRIQLATAPLAANLGSTRIEWIIDSSPCVRHLIAEVASELNGLLHIMVTVELASLFPIEMLLCLARGDHVLSAEVFWTNPETEFEERKKFSLAISRSETVGSPLKIQVRNNHEQIYTSDLDVPPPALNPSSIEHLVLAYRDTRSVSYLTEIFLRYVFRFEEACHEQLPARTVNRIGTGANAESETALKVSLKILEMVISGSTAFQALPSFLGVDPVLSALASSTWLLLSSRFAAAGLLNPMQFAEAVKLAQSAYSLPDTRIRGFASLACRFAKHAEEREQLSTGARWTVSRDAFSAGSALYESIGRWSSDVGTWLRNLINEQEAT